MRAANECYSDAEDPLYVYDWRLQPERAMREEKGRGMSDEQVINFVNGCKYSRSRERYVAIDEENRLSRI